MRGGEQQTITLDAAEMPHEPDRLKGKNVERAKQQYLTAELTTCSDDGEWFERRQIRGREERSCLRCPTGAEDRADIRQRTPVVPARDQELKQLSSRDALVRGVREEEPHQRFDVGWSGDGVQVDDLNACPCALALRQLKGP